MLNIKLDHALKFQLLVLLVVLLILEGLLIVHLIRVVENKDIGTIIPILDNSINQQLNTRRIDGLLVDENFTNIYPAAVVIDNHPDSRPNYGLSKASLVYETLVEGSHTRFLIFYTPNKDQDEPLKKIGPVRSARPYFVDIVKEYDALFAHAGGSPQAIRNIPEFGIHSMDEIAWWGEDYYWRVYSRSAPHNLFTSEENLAKALVDWQLSQKSPDYRAWKFKSKLDNDISNDQEIYIDFSLNDDFDASYVYSTTTKDYLRFQGGEEHLDALTNQQVAVANVVVQYVNQEKVLDAVGRIQLELTGQGDASIFRDGVQINGSWKRRSLDSRTIFYDEQDEEIYFKPGNIWIEIVPGSLQVTVK